MAHFSWMRDERDAGWMMFHDNGGFDEIDIDPRIEVRMGRTCNGGWEISAHLKNEEIADRNWCDVAHDVISIVPKRILKSGDRTIVFWQDGTKTIVKRAEDEADNDYAAFTAAFAIKMFGSNSALKRMIAKKTELQKPKRKHGMKFKVGDIVRTKSGLKVGETYDEITFWSTMETKRATIETADPSDKTYYLNNFWYAEEMLELVKEGGAE